MGKSKKRKVVEIKKKLNCNCVRLGLRQLGKKLYKDIEPVYKCILCGQKTDR